MNRFIAISLLAAVCAAGQAFADDITPADAFTSTRDRAEVRTELDAARGAANPWSIAYNPLATFQSGRTAAAVRAEYVTARDEVAELTGEDSGSFALSQSPTVRNEVAALHGAE